MSFNTFRRDLAIYLLIYHKVGLDDFFLFQFKNIPGHIQSPVGILASTSTFPYFMVKPLVLRNLADCIGLIGWSTDPSLLHPQNILLVHISALEPPKA